MLEKIKNQYHSMTDSQKVICQYILENYSIVATLSAAEFAAEVGVSDATIVRFAQEIGFSGFTEMKNYLRTIMKGPEAPYQKFLENSEIAGKYETVLRMGQNDIKEMEELLLSYDEAVMQSAVKAIYAARNIYFVALGSAATIQEFLILHLRRMGFNTIAISESGSINFEKLVTITPDDLLIVVCFPRYSANTQKVIKLARQQKAKILAITDSKKSVIALNADMVLPVKMEAKIFFHSYVVPMTLCNILLMEVFEHDRKRIEESIKDNMKKIQFFE